MSTASPSNKFRTAPKEAPTEPFKRAVTSCLRAIARQPELEVTFAIERPGLSPGKARLPEPGRKMSRRDAAIVRGHADSIALKIACHDPKVHRKLMPGNPQAKGVFDAVEQARVEAIGSRRMTGVAKNLTAMLDDHFHRGGARAWPADQNYIGTFVGKRLGQGKAHFACRVVSDKPNRIYGLHGRACRNQYCFTC